MDRLLATLGKGVLALLVVAIAMRALVGRDWHVERTATIAAPPEALLRLVSDLGGWPAFAGVAQLDRDGSWQPGGPIGKPGHFVEFDGRRSGHGKLVLKAADSSGIVYEVQLSGASGPVSGSIRLAAEGSGTRVTWTDAGQGPPILGGVLQRFVQQKLGDELDANLQRLSALAARKPGP